MPYTSSRQQPLSTPNTQPLPAISGPSLPVSRSSLPNVSGPSVIRPAVPSMVLPSGSPLPTSSRPSLVLSSSSPLPAVSDRHRSSSSGSVLNTPPLIGELSPSQRLQVSQPPFKKLGAHDWKTKFN